jgi:hypothetical protein
MYMHTCAPFSLLSLFMTHDFYRACTAGFPTSCETDEDTWEPLANLTGEGVKKILRAFNKEERQKKAQAGT